MLQVSEKEELTVKALAQCWESSASVVPGPHRRSVASSLLSCYSHFLEFLHLVPFLMLSQRPQ